MKTNINNYNYFRIKINLNFYLNAFTIINIMYIMHFHIFNSSEPLKLGCIIK